MSRILVSLLVLCATFAGLAIADGLAIDAQADTQARERTAGRGQTTTDRGSETDPSPPEALGGTSQRTAGLPEQLPEKMFPAQSTYPRKPLRKSPRQTRKFAQMHSLPKPSPRAPAKPAARARPQPSPKARANTATNTATRANHSATKLPTDLFGNFLLSQTTDREVLLTRQRSNTQAWRNLVHRAETEAREGPNCSASGSAGVGQCGKAHSVAIAGRRLCKETTQLYVDLLQLDDAILPDAEQRKFLAICANFDRAAEYLVYNVYSTATGRPQFRHATPDPSPVQVQPLAPDADGSSSKSLQATEPAPAISRSLDNRERTTPRPPPSPSPAPIWVLPPGYRY